MQNRLREIRKDKGLTQGLLSLKSGVCRTSIARYETGRKGMSARNLLRIAGALGVSVDDILKGGQDDGAAAQCG